ncbi:MAG: lysylphosphatidylglycerol synthase transmembrane domain-containing protein [Aquihabitans sp.]
MKRTILILLMLFVLFYVVIPSWTAQQDTARKLQQVNPILLVLAVSLEIAALVAYAVLTRVTLPATPRLGLWTVFRVQLATRAVTNVVPGGSAAGGTLGYRLFTQLGVPPTAAGFSMATVGLGSAVVLNAILWVFLIISIPLNGFKTAYVWAALIGVILLLAAAALVWSLMEGRSRSEGVVRAIARRIPFVKEDTAARFVHQLADRLHDLAQQPELVRRGVVWAAANWMLDAAALWVFLRAFGASVDPVILIVAFGLAQVVAAIPITPGGLGVVEATLPAALAGFGVPPSIALAGVLAWRFAQFWLPIPLGGLAYLTLRFGTLSGGAGSVPREQLVQTAYRRVWDDETGEYRTTRVTLDADGEHHTILPTGSDDANGDDIGLSSVDDRPVEDRAAEDPTDDDPTDDPS